MTPRRLLAVMVLLILWATLTPDYSEPLQPWTLCLLCSRRGLADILCNIILYGPLGACAALAGWRGWRVMLFAAVLSLGCESAQMFIPGRDPSVTDLSSNVVGAGAGLVLARTARWWLLPDPRRAGLLTLAGAVTAAGVFTLTGLLLVPSFPHSTYWVQWTPKLGHLEWYRGRVLQASLGGLDLPPDRPLPNSSEVRNLLLTGAPLRLTAVAGPPVPSLASLFSIADEHPHEIFLVGPDRTDLVLRYRTRAAAVRLDQPDLRLADLARPLAAGDSFTLRVWRDGAGYCVQLNTAQACRNGFTIGDGWALLYYGSHWPAWYKELLRVFWVAFLLLPLGLWGRRGWPSVVGGVSAAAGLVVIPALVRLEPTTASQLLGALAGVALGVGLQAGLRARARGPLPAQPTPVAAPSS